MRQKPPAERWRSNSQNAAGRSCGSYLHGLTNRTQQRKTMHSYTDNITITLSSRRTSGISDKISRHGNSETTGVRASTFDCTMVAGRHKYSAGALTSGNEPHFCSSKDVSVSHNITRTLPANQDRKYRYHVYIVSNCMAQHHSEL